MKYLYLAILIVVLVSQQIRVAKLERDVYKMQLHVYHVGHKDGTEE